MPCRRTGNMSLSNKKKRNMRENFIYNKMKAIVDLVILLTSCYWFYIKLYKPKNSSILPYELIFDVQFTNIIWQGWDTITGSSKTDNIGFSICDCKITKENIWGKKIQQILPLHYSYNHERLVLKRTPPPSPPLPTPQIKNVRFSW